jgi:urocanate hydratase
MTLTSDTDAIAKLDETARNLADEVRQRYHRWIEITLLEIIASGVPPADISIVHSAFDFKISIYVNDVCVASARLEMKKR